MLLNITYRMNCEFLIRGTEKHRASRQQGISKNMSQKKRKRMNGMEWNGIERTQEGSLCDSH